MSDLELKAQYASSILAAAELHGMVCGFAAGRPGEFSMSDFVQLAGADVLSDEESVSEFVSSALDHLFSVDMTFVPLIPDDSEDLVHRLTGLAQFSAGFLSGFGASCRSVSMGDAWPEDVQEILRDLASISGLDEEAGGDEQDEGSFMELFEYVRVAAVLAVTLMRDMDETETVPVPGEHA